MDNGNDTEPTKDSLRAAIIASNKTPGVDIIQFNIGDGVQVITPLTLLPEIRDPVVINGRRTDGLQQMQSIVLKGSKAVDVGLNITAGQTTVVGLTFIGFNDAAIVLDNLKAKNGTVTITGGNTIIGNFIGTDSAGTSGVGNKVGVLVLNSDNVIGGTTAEMRNVISGNTDDGILIINKSKAEELTVVSNNRVVGNFIGTDPTGLRRLANGGNGVSIRNASVTIIGGADAASANVISGNDENGVFIKGSKFNDDDQTKGLPLTYGNVVIGNFIGTDKTGNALLRNASGSPVDGNQKYGVVIQNSNGNFVGSAAANDSRNIISGNALGGVHIFTRNLRVILGAFTGGGGNTVQRNFIGTNSTGTAALGNGPKGNGVYIEDSIKQTVRDNVISGNKGFGIQIAIGRDTAAQYNDFDARPIAGTTHVNNLISGNTIGLDAKQSTPLANGTMKDGDPATAGGIRIFDSPNNLLVGNVVSANRFDGISLAGGANQNVLRGNLIGTDGTGSAIKDVDGRSLGNSRHGVFIDQSRDNVIGGASDDRRNTISGNGMNGIDIANIGSTGTFILRNNIGTDKNGHVNPAAAKKLGNANNGIEIGVDVKGTRIKENQIAYNGGAGVKVKGQFTSISDPNLIFSNGGLGIDIAGGQEDAFGVTANDTGDTDGRQNYPILNSAVDNKSATTVTGTLSSRPNQTFLLEFFANSEQDPSGHGEGEFFIGSQLVQTSNVGTVEFSFVSSSPEAATGTFITATATDALGNTSEFSAVVSVTRVAAPTTTSVVSSSPVTITNVPVLLTATVGSAGGTPTGSVQFLVNGFAYGSPVALSGGSASIVLNGLPVDMYGLSALYSGDSDFAASIGFATQFVSPAPTEIRVVSFINPAEFGESGTLFGLAFRAIPPSGFFPIAPSGFIIISDTFEGVTTTLAVNVLGQPPSPLPTLAVGTHAIVAAYSGDLNFLGSISAPLFQDIVPAPEPPTAPLTAEQQALDAYFAQVS